MKKKLIFMSLAMLLLSCGTAKKENGAMLNRDKTNLQEKAACDSIHELINVWENEGQSNFRINNIVGFLEQKSGLESTSDKGTYGYLYSLHPDSVFYSDVNRWRKYFNCK